MQIASKLKDTIFNDHYRIAVKSESFGGKNEQKSGFLHNIFVHLMYINERLVCKIGTILCTFGTILCTFWRRFLYIWRR